MNPRVQRHARKIVNYSTKIESGDNVVIDAHPTADELVTALYKEIAGVGANPLTVRQRMGKRFRRAYLRKHDGRFNCPSHEMALFKEMDVYIAVRSGNNVHETTDINPETSVALNQARKPLRDERMTKRWCLTHFPTPAYAQLAEMSTEEYRRFVWDAILNDWDSQRERQEQLVEILDNADEVHIVSGDTTDIKMSIAGNSSFNECGEINLPGGEVFTAPVIDSVEGEVLFDKPLTHQGREIKEIQLSFEQGSIVNHSAAKNEELLTELINVDDGARRIGELGFGMNRKINKFTYNMLFDEKMGDTVHMALGRAYQRTVGDMNRVNDSAIHIDMIVDMSHNSRIEIDGEVIQRNGWYAFEDEFE